MVSMVTISRQAGAGGDEVARMLAEQLGWRLLDNEGVERLLVAKGFRQAAVESFNERKPDLWHRFSTAKERYLHFLKLVTYDFARQGSCVILGRGGQILLAEVPGVVRVRVVAPLEDRVARVRELDGGDESRARQAVEHTDNQRMGFYRLLFHADWDCFDLYDLVINSHLVSEKTAAELIVKTLGAKEVTRTRREASRKLKDLYLTEKAIIAILFQQKLPIHCLEIGVEDGAVTLKGTARDHPSIERAEEVAATVFSLKRIENEICFGPTFAEIMAGVHRNSAIKERAGTWRG
jgi:cytidylate kinase